MTADMWIDALILAAIIGVGLVGERWLDCRDARKRLKAMKDLHNTPRP